MKILNIFLAAISLLVALAVFGGIAALAEMFRVWIDAETALSIVVAVWFLVFGLLYTMASALDDDEPMDGPTPTAPAT